MANKQFVASGQFVPQHNMMYQHRGAGGAIGGGCNGAPSGGAGGGAGMGMLAASVGTFYNPSFTVSYDEIPIVRMAVFIGVGRESAIETENLEEFRNTMQYKGDNFVLLEYPQEVRYPKSLGDTPDGPESNYRKEVRIRYYARVNDRVFRAINKTILQVEFAKLLEDRAVIE